MTTSGDIYVPTELAEVFEDLWLVVRPSDPPLNSKQEARLRLAIAEFLVELKRKGVTDARELYRRAREHFLPTAT